MTRADAARVGNFSDGQTPAASFDLPDCSGNGRMDARVGETIDQKTLEHVNQLFGGNGVKFLTRERPKSGALQMDATADDGIGGHSAHESCYARPKPDANEDRR